MKKFILSIFILIFLTSMISDKPAYILYEKSGNPVSYQQLFEQASKSDIVLFGELHNNPICHWLELELTEDLFKAKGNDLVMGAEMFETDDQLLIDEFLTGRIKESNFDAEAKLWNNYKTDYKPLLNFARNNKINFIATNIPRRYSALVNKNGFEVLDSLTKDAKLLFAPLPIKYDSTLNCYSSILKTAGAGGNHISVNLPKAQAIKDVTMSYFIVKNLRKNQLFLHFNGTYHSEDFESMVWYLKDLNPKLKITTIASVEQKDISTLSTENINKADFIICIPEKMTKTN